MAAELCYVEGEARGHYLHDMRICQRWAVLNRRLIAMLLMRFFGDVAVLDEFESVHNYISDDNMVRKGSISAAEGERCIIPPEHARRLLALHRQGQSRLEFPPQKN